jgi:hypothetical protein
LRSSDIGSPAGTDDNLSERALFGRRNPAKKPASLSDSEGGVVLRRALLVCDLLDVVLLRLALLRDELFAVLLRVVAAARALVAFPFPLLEVRAVLV